MATTIPVFTAQLSLLDSLRGDAPDFGAFGDDNYRPGFGSSRRTGGSTAETVDAAPAAAETTLVLPDGVLVDVLA